MRVASTFTIKPNSNGIQGAEAVEEGRPRIT